MDWEDLKVFLNVTEAGSLAGAARRLRVSQATIWRRIRALEKSLDVALFERRPTGYVLTSAGASFLRRVDGVQRTIEVACRQTADHTEAAQGDVRITAPDFVGTIIAERLPELAERHPRLIVELLTGSPAGTLMARDVDIALRVDRLPSPGFALEAVYAIPCGLYAAKNYLERFGSPTAIDDLEGHRLIEFDHSTAHVAPDAWERSAKKGATIAFRASSPHARLAAAQAGLGLAMLCEPLAAIAPGLRPVLSSAAVGNLDLMMFVSAGLRRERRVIAVRNLLAQILSNLAPRRI